MRVSFTIIALPILSAAFPCAACGQPGDLAGQPFVTMPVSYQGKTLIAATKEGVAAIAFDKPIKDGVTYRFRFRSSDGKAQLEGMGSVFEKYKTRTLLFMSFVEDDGGHLKIKAGPIQLCWSYCCQTSGYIYYNPKKTRIKAIDATDLNKIDLKRYAIGRLSSSR